MHVLDTNGANDSNFFMLRKKGNSVVKCNEIMIVDDVIA